MPKPFKKTAGAISGGGIESQASEAEGKENVLLDVEVLQQSEVLKNETDSCESQTSPRGFSQDRKIRLVDHHSTGSRRDDPGSQAEQRRLTATTGADHGDRLASTDFQQRNREAKPVDGTRRRPDSRIEDRSSEARGRIITRMKRFQSTLLLFNRPWRSPARDGL